MTTRDLLVVAAAAAFSLAGIASVNDSELINVALPSQYRTVWDQSAFHPDINEAAALRRPARLEIEAPGAGRFGTVARNVLRRHADRG